MDLDTLYESSEQELSEGPQPQATGGSSIDSLTTEATKMAKLLPEMRVSQTVSRVTPASPSPLSTESGYVWKMPRHPEAM